MITYDEVIAKIYERDSSDGWFSMYAGKGIKLFRELIALELGKHTDEVD